MADKEKPDFELSPLARERLNELSQQLQIPPAEVLRRALKVYDWVEELLKTEKLKEPE